MTNKSFERLFQFFAAVLIATAVYFFLWGNYENVFVAAVVGSLCFFIGIRFQVKQRLEIRDNERQQPGMVSGETDFERTNVQVEDDAFEMEHRD
jgi:hypothetical protein